MKIASMWKYPKAENTASSKQTAAPASRRKGRGAGAVFFRLAVRLPLEAEEGRRPPEEERPPDDFDWDAAFARLATMDKQAEWEDFVAKYQKAVPGSSSSEKWQLMECMFKLPGASK